MYDFHITDLAMSIIPKSKFYWHNMLTNSCIVVEDSVALDDSLDGEVTIHFVQGQPGDKVVAIPDDFFWEESVFECLLPEHLEIKSNKEPYVTSIKLSRIKGKVQKNCAIGSRIMDSVINLIENHSWAFPRRIPLFPYISERQCYKNEEFMKGLIYEQHNMADFFVLAVDKAGVLLAERMGISLDGVIKIKHYLTAENEQLDSLADGIELQLSEGATPADLKNSLILVIDDLISSGITATRIISHLRKLGPEYISFYSLYRTLASQEVPINNAPDVEYTSCFPLSNCYWVYGRGFDLSDEESRSLKDIYGAQKCWDWESEVDIKAVLELFNSPYRYEDYVELALRGE